MIGAAASVLGEDTRLDPVVLKTIHRAGAACNTGSFPPKSPAQMLNDACRRVASDCYPTGPDDRERCKHALGGLEETMASVSREAREVGGKELVPLVGAPATEPAKAVIASFKTMSSALDEAERPYKKLATVWTRVVATDDEIRAACKEATIAPQAAPLIPLPDAIERASFESTRQRVVTDGYTESTLRCSRFELALNVEEIVHAEETAHRPSTQCDHVKEARAKDPAAAVAPRLDALAARICK